VPSLQAVDNRLFYVDGRRLVRLRKEDLPELTRVLIAVIRKRARAGVARVKNVDYVELVGQGANALVLRSDWELILPFVQDESFNTLFAPVEPPVRYLEPVVAYNEPILDRADRFLYGRILGILTGLFPDSTPVAAF
jgi:hypothetical protein